jgi:hypothetical protein
MTRQESDLEDIDYYLWAKRVIPEEELGKLHGKNNGWESEDWEVSEEQERIIEDAKNDLRKWYQTQEVKARILMLDKDTYAAFQLRLWAYGRASWPKEYLGPKPTNMVEVTTAERMIQNTEWKEELKPAIAHYYEWWISERINRNKEERNNGDRIFYKAQKLYLKLHREKLHKGDVEILQCYMMGVPVNWPFDDIGLPGESMVQLETLTEWNLQIRHPTNWKRMVKNSTYYGVWDDYKSISQWEETMLPIID